MLRAKVLRKRNKRERIFPRVGVFVKALCLNAPLHDRRTSIRNRLGVKMSVKVDFGTSTPNPAVRRIAGRVILGITAVAGMASTSSEALAQACGGGAGLTFFNNNSNRVTTPLGPVFSGGATAAGAIISSIEASNSVFLTQSNAFISAPPNPKPDSQGGGVWVRGVGGEVTYSGNSTVTTSGAITPNGTTDCPTQFRQSFGGFQVGQDVAKLNVFGWNLHVGQTAGYIEANGHSTGNGGASAIPFSTTTQIPFVGAYAAATNGGFFVDALVRWNWVENSLNSPGINLNDQKLDAHGVSVSASAGYHWDVPSSTWFIEPSLGVIWSRTSVDPLNMTAGSIGPPNNMVNGTLQFNTIDSLIGRAGLRFGTTMQAGNLIYQPFAAVSVWHEFDDDIQSTFTVCSACVGTGPASASITTPNIGTYGQYSLGVNGQIANTGWLGYVRVDYRNGDRIEGWSGTGGIRYQFNPLEGAPAAGLYKAPVKAPIVERAPNWTGLYIGAFGGAVYGGSKMEFPGLGAAGPQVAGALGGGTLGYNYQMGPWVLGIEGDAGWTNARGSVACAGPVGINQVLFSTDCAGKADFIATAAARLGYAWGRALYYAKAGGAWTHESFTVTCNQPTGTPIPCNNPAGAPLTQISVGDDRAGWTAGYGVEFALTPNWSAKGEVNYIDFGNRNLTAQDGTVINAGMRVTEGKIGVNYRF
jgi:outer membrane autotransporter protein